MNDLIWKTVLEGCGLGIILILVCAFGIRKGAIGMIQLYNQDVQQRCIELGLITPKKIKLTSLRFKVFALPVYIVYILVCVYVINQAKGFLAGFWQILLILSVLNLIDRFIIDELWVGHTNTWTINGTEDLKPYINKRNKLHKWIFGTIGSIAIAALLSLIMTIFIH